MNKDYETMIELLQTRADESTCNGTCDLEPPHVPCRGCKATRALNAAGDLFRDALMLDYRTASKLSLQNREHIKEGVSCGCYFCLQIVDGSKIEEWTKDDSALCPRCNIDAIVPNETDIKYLVKACEMGFYNTKTKGE